MVPYWRNGLHHSHLVTVATAHPHVPTLEHMPLTRRRLPLYRCMGLRCQQRAHSLTHKTPTVPLSPLQPLERTEIAFLHFSHAVVDKKTLKGS